MRVKAVSQGRCREDLEYGHGAQMDGWGESLHGDNMNPWQYPAREGQEKGADGINILNVSS